MTLSIILVVICFIVVAMMWNEGLWTNAISLCNVVFAGIISSNYFEPLANTLEENLPSFGYLVDYIAFWGIFALVFNVFRAITDQVSQFKVQFRKPLEPIGNVIFALLTAWVMVCIFTASLHIAPLALSPMKASFGESPTASCFFGLSPDKYWWAFVHSRSKGALSAGKPFDPNGEFVLRYGKRRYELQLYNKSSDGKLRTKNGR